MKPHAAVDSSKSCGVVLTLLVELRRGLLLVLRLPLPLLCYCRQPPAPAYCRQRLPTSALPCQYSRTIYKPCGRILRKKPGLHEPTLIHKAVHHGWTIETVPSIVLCRS